MLCLWLFRLAPCFFSVFPFSLFSLAAALPLSLSLSLSLSSAAVALERFACAFSLFSRQISPSCSNSFVVAAAAAAYLVLVSAGLPSQFSSLVCFLHTTQDLCFLFFFFSSQGFASLLLLFAFKAGALEGNGQRAHLYGLNIAVSPLPAPASFLPFRLSS